MRDGRTISPGSPRAQNEGCGELGRVPERLSVLMAATTAYPDATGGRETYIYEMSRALAGLGHAVTVVTGTGNGELPADELVDGVTFARYRVNDANLISLVSSRVRSMRQRIEGLLSSGPGFDVVNYHGPWSAKAVRGVHGLARVTKVYTFHSPESREVELLLQDSRGAAGRGLGDHLRPVYLTCYKRLAHRAERSALQRSGAVVCLSEYMKDMAVEYHGLPESKVRVVPGGVDTVRFAPGTGSGAAQRVGAAEACNRSTKCAPPNGSHGSRQLVAAMPEILRQVPDVLLVIGGKGGQEAALRRQVEQLGIEGHVRLVGYIPSEDLPTHYRAADLFVLPSTDLEGFGLVTLEALACGTPVLGTQVGGTAELLAVFGTTMLVPANSPDSLAAGVTSALRAIAHGQGPSPEECRRYASCFKWRAVAEALSTVYESAGPAGAVQHLGRRFGA